MDLLNNASAFRLLKTPIDFIDLKTLVSTTLRAVGGYGICFQYHVSYQIVSKLFEDYSISYSILVIGYIRLRSFKLKGYFLAKSLLKRFFNTKI